MQTRGHRTCSPTNLESHPRARPHETPNPESDPLEALCIVPLYLVVIAWILWALGWWNY